MAKLLARALEYISIDTDELAERISKKTISEIFEQDGEDAFRELETAIMKVTLPLDCLV